MRPGARPEVHDMDPGTSENFSLNSTGTLLAHGFHQPGIRIRNMADWSVVRDIAGSGTWSTCVFSPDGNRLFTGDAAGFTLLDTQSWQTVWKKSSENNGSLGKAAWFSPNGTSILTSLEPGIITLLDARTGATVVNLHRDSAELSCHLAINAENTRLWQLDMRTQVLWMWDLNALRKYLQPLGLDWEAAGSELPSCRAQAPALGLGLSGG